MRLITVLIAASLFSRIAVGQAAYAYTNGSSDGYNVWVTGVIQNQPCCGPSAIHTYSQVVSITSPSGRSNNCSFSYDNPAGQYVSYQCETTLSLTGSNGAVEAGNYALGGYQQAVCSVAGTFLDLDLGNVIKVVFSTSGYSITGPTSGGWSYFQNSPCNCTCKGPNPLIRSQEYSYWNYERVGVSLFGFTLCSSRVVVDEGSANPVSCEDSIISPP